MGIFLLHDHLNKVVANTSPEIFVGNLHHIFLTPYLFLDSVSFTFSEAYTYIYISPPKPVLEPAVAPLTTTGLLGLSSSTTATALVMVKFVTTLSIYVNY